MKRLWHDAKAKLDQYVEVGSTLRQVRIRNMRRYLGDHHDRSPGKGMVQSTLNKTGAAIVTTAAVQTELPWRLNLTARESGEIPVYFLTSRGLRKIQQATQSLANGQGGLSFSGGLSVSSLSPLTQLPEEMGEQLEKFTRARFDPLTGQMVPAILEEDRDLIMVTDAMCATQMQTVCEALYSATNIDMYTAEAETLTNIVGDQTISFQWNLQTSRPVWALPNWTNVLFDPKAQWVNDCRYCFLDQRVPVLEAAGRYPSFKDQIRSLATGRGSAGDPDSQGGGSVSGAKEGGSSSWQNSTSQSYPGILDPESEDTAEQFVTIRTFWKRGELFRTPKGSSPDQDEGAENHGKVSSEDSEDLLKNSEVTEEELENGIRQIQYWVEGDRIVEDVRCPYADIPLPWMKNRLLPYSPYGIGEPFNLESLQNIINRIVTVIENTIRYNQYPEEILPTSVKQSLGEQLEQFRKHPGRVIELSDDTFEMLARLTGGRFNFGSPAPEVPASLVQLLQIFLREFQTIAGDVDVIGGQPPSSDTSGVALDTLQAAGSRVMAFKAKHMEWTFEYLSRLMIDAVVQWMPDEVWLRWTSKYQGAVLQAIRDRSKNLEFDIRVEAVAGRTANKRLKVAQANQMRDRGDLSRETYLEMNDHPDPQGEMERIENEIQRQQMSAANQMAAASPGEEQPPTSPIGREEFSPMRESVPSVQGDEGGLRI